MHPDIVAHQSRLNSTLAFARKLVDAEAQGHFARYICVLTSGFIEQAIRVHFGAYAQTHASPELVRFISKELETFQNPKVGKVIALLQKFSEDWAREVQRGIEGRISDHVDSIVARRHEIAHGKPSGLSLGTATEYMKSAFEFLEVICSKCA